MLKFTQMFIIISVAELPKMSQLAQTLPVMTSNCIATNQNSKKFNNSEYSASMWHMEYIPLNQVIIVSETMQTPGKKTLFPLHLA